MRSFTTIDDVDDPRIAPFRDLQRPRDSTKAAHFVAEGNFLVDRLLASVYEVESVLVQRGREERFAEVAVETPVFVADSQLLREIVGYDFHRGVLACGIRRPFKSTGDLLFDDSQNVAVGLLGISDQENVGSILRSAAAFGIDRVLIDDRTIDPLARRSIRVSMGTVFKHQIFRFGDTLNEIRQVQQRDVRVIASTLDQSASPLSEFRIDQRPMLLMMGNESQGLSQETQSVCNERLRIEMRLETDSLNVAVAAAVMMHAITTKSL